MNAIIDSATRIGFSKAVALENLTVECEEHLRAYCNPDGCPNHGQNWVCPLGCSSLVACAEEAARFRRGVVLQSVTDIAPTSDMRNLRVGAE